MIWPGDEEGLWLVTVEDGSQCWLVHRRVGATSLRRVERGGEAFRLELAVAAACSVTALVRSDLRKRQGPGRTPLQLQCRIMDGRAICGLLAPLVPISIAGLGRMLGYDSKHFAATVRLQRIRLRQNVRPDPPPRAVAFARRFAQAVSLLRRVEGLGFQQALNEHLRRLP